MDNTVLFSSGVIEISRTIARFGNTSYPIANIGSVSVERSEKSPLLTFATILLIIAIIMYFTRGLPWALMIGAVALAVLYIAAQELTLTLKTSSGDVQALRTRDAALAASVKAAIEQAFTMR